MNTEKEQKVLEYLEKKEQEPRSKLVYDLFNPDKHPEPEEIISSLEKQGFTKEKLVKDIEEYNLVATGLTKDDLSPETVKRLDRVVLIKLKTQRRIFMWNGVSDIPEIETI